MQQQNPQWHWQLIYDYLKNDPSNPGPFTPYTDYQTLQGFILGRHLQYDSFLYDDPTDDTVTNQTLSLVTDGAGNFYSPIQRNFGGQFLEDITDLNPIDASGLSREGQRCNESARRGFHGHRPGLCNPRILVAWSGHCLEGINVGCWAPIFTYATNDTIIDPAGHIQKATTGGCPVPQFLRSTTLAARQRMAL